MRSQMIGNRVAVQRLKEKAIRQVGQEAIKLMLEGKENGLPLRKIAGMLNEQGFKTANGKPYQQAQVKRTLDRLAENTSLLTVTTINENVTTGMIKKEDLLEVVKPFRELIDSSSNPNQPRLKKLSELINKLDLTLKN
ncbi:MAG: hypothetical protein BWK78_04760 [Thiotrichaceae bacterium IS1]|nr:MAG: hypothetical protein BWK78_04760 [Thiotrichaceae bacterium IS1]